MYAPVDHQKFLGSTFVKRFDEVALQVGKTTWSRHELANTLGVGNYRAAAIVTRVLRELKIGKMEDVFTCDPTDLAGIHNLGETGMWVLLRALEAKGFNPKEWYSGVESTFRTVKIRRKKAEEAERKERRKKRGRK